MLVAIASIPRSMEQLERAAMVPDTGTIPAVRHIGGASGPDALPGQFLMLHDAGIKPPRRRQHHRSVLEADMADLIAADPAGVGRSVNARRQRRAVERVVAGVGHELPRLAGR